MTNFTVEHKVEGDVFTITYTKEIEDINGNLVTIVDRTEDVTIKQLQERKEGIEKSVAGLKTEIAEIDEKIAVMEKTA